MYVSVTRERCFIGLRIFSQTGIFAGFLYMSSILPEGYYLQYCREWIATMGSGKGGGAQRPVLCDIEPKKSDCSEAKTYLYYCTVHTVIIKMEVF
jgi:hypothetical protein